MRPNFRRTRPSHRIIEHADGWFPSSLAHPTELTDQIRDLRARAQEASRDPADIDITVCCLERTSPQRVTEYTAMGANRVVLRAPTSTTERFTEFLSRYNSLLPHGAHQEKQ